jgi:hypothetical protein
MMPIHVERLKPDKGMLEAEVDVPEVGGEVLVAVGAPASGRDGEVAVAKVASEGLVYWEKIDSSWVHSPPVVVAGIFTAFWVYPALVQ